MRVRRAALGSRGRYTVAGGWLVAAVASPPLASWPKLACRAAVTRASCARRASCACHCERPLAAMLALRPMRERRPLRCTRTQRPFQRSPSTGFGLSAQRLARPLFVAYAATATAATAAAQPREPVAIAHCDSAQSPLPVSCWPSRVRGPQCRL